MLLLRIDGVVRLSPCLTPSHRRLTAQFPFPLIAIDMRQPLRDFDLAPRHALDHAFRRRFEVQVLGHQPFDKRGQLRAAEAFPPSQVDRTLDCPAGNAFAIRRWPFGFFPPGSGSSAQRCSRSARWLMSGRKDNAQDARRAQVSAPSRGRLICVVRPRRPPVRYGWWSRPTSPHAVA
jgi:hypothetical protein